MTIDFYKQQCIITDADDTAQAYELNRKLGGFFTITPVPDGGDHQRMAVALRDSNSFTPLATSYFFACKTCAKNMFTEIENNEPCPNCLTEEEQGLPAVEYELVLSDLLKTYELGKENAAQFNDAFVENGISYEQYVYQLERTHEGRNFIISFEFIIERNRKKIDLYRTNNSFLLNGEYFVTIELYRKWKGRINLINMDLCKNTFENRFNETYFLI